MSDSSQKTQTTYEKLSIILAVLALYVSFLGKSNVVTYCVIVVAIIAGLIIYFTNRYAYDVVTNQKSSVWGVFRWFGLAMASGSMVFLMGFAIMDYHERVDQEEKEKAPIKLCIKNIAFQTNSDEADFLKSFPAEYTVTWADQKAKHGNEFVKIKNKLSDGEYRSYSELPEDKRQAYLDELQALGKCVHNRVNMMTSIGPLKIASYPQVTSDSFKFDIKTDDKRLEEYAWIKSITIKVNHFYSLRVHSNRSPAGPLPSAIAYIPVKNRQLQLPWEFPALYNTIASTSTIEQYPRPWSEQRITASGKSIRTVFVKVIPYSPGIYVYSASLVMEDSQGHTKPFVLIPEDNPRVIAAIGTFDEESDYGKLYKNDERYQDFVNKWVLDHMSINLLDKNEMTSEDLTQEDPFNPSDKEPAPPPPPPKK